MAEGGVGRTVGGGGETVTTVERRSIGRLAEEVEETTAGAGAPFCASEMFPGWSPVKDGDIQGAACLTTEVGAEIAC